MKKEDIKEWKEAQKQLKDIVPQEGLFVKLWKKLFAETKSLFHIHKFIWSEDYEETWYTYRYGIKIPYSEHQRIFQDGKCNCGYIIKREIRPEGRNK